MNIFNKKEEMTNSPSEEVENWLGKEEDEGQLSVDVYEQDENIVVRSTVAGAKSEDIEINVQDDTLIIKGKREMPDDVSYLDYLYRECYWGKFSRTIILPVPIKEDKVRAELENGILKIILPISQRKDHLIKVKKK